MLGADEKRCWACQKVMPAKAIVCVECKSFQNWRKYLDYSSTALSLMIALISVTTTLFAVTKGRERARSGADIHIVNSRVSDIDYKTGGKQSHGPTFCVEGFVRNSGNAPTTIRSFSLKHPKQEGKGLPMVVRTTDDTGRETTERAVAPTTLLISPGQTKIFSAHCLIENAEDVKEAIVVAEIVDHGGALTTKLGFV